MLTAALAAGAVGAMVGFRYLHVRKRQDQILRFFQRHAVFYGTSDRGWLRSSYLANAFGQGVYPYLWSMLDDGLIERREGGTPAERWARGGRPVIFYRLRAR